MLFCFFCVSLSAAEKITRIGILSPWASKLHALPKFVSPRASVSVGGFVLNLRRNTDLVQQDGRSADRAGISDRKSPSRCRRRRDGRGGAPAGTSVIRFRALNPAGNCFACMHAFLTFAGSLHLTTSRKKPLRPPRETCRAARPQQHHCMDGRAPQAFFVALSHLSVLLCVGTICVLAATVHARP